MWFVNTQALPTNALIEKVAGDKHLGIYHGTLYERISL